MENINTVTIDTTSYSIADTVARSSLAVLNGDASVVGSIENQINGVRTQLQSRFQGWC